MSDFQNLARIVGVVAIFGIAMLGAVALWFRPVFRAWARRIENAAVTDDVQRELDELRTRVAELEAGLGQVHDLEDRLEFAERLLVQRKESAPLPLNRTPA